MGVLKQNVGLNENKKNLFFFDLQMPVVNTCTRTWHLSFQERNWLSEYSKGANGNSYQQRGLIMPTPNDKAKKSILKKSSNRFTKQYRKEQTTNNETR